MPEINNSAKPEIEDEKPSLDEIFAAPSISVEDVMFLVKYHGYSDDEINAKIDHEMEKQKQRKAILIEKARKRINDEPEEYGKEVFRRVLSFIENKHMLTKKANLPA